MRLLGNTRDLKIVVDAWKEQQEGEKGKVAYPLYEANYITGLREIFKDAIRQRDWIEKNKERFFLDEKRNILTFVGKRGSGKTTAMDEFCQILNSLEKDTNRKWWIEHTLEKEEQELLLRKEFKFQVLSPIDASLLEEKENLFELILSNIYRKYEKQIENRNLYGFEDDVKTQQIMRLFSEIFKSYRSLNNHKDEEEYGNFIVSRMQFMQGSQQIQKKVNELIDDLFMLQGSKCDYEYIVIPIDDLDLNLRHGYEMLEQLQKYFSYYKIIVLIALDYEQMKLVCEEYFRREMQHTTKAYDETGRIHIIELASDYMTKLFHFSQRMYTPDMQRLSRKAEIVVKDTENTLGNLEERTMQVKNFVINKVAESMHIFYDACGNQSHFSEPTTVRELVSYNEFLESLNIIEYDELVGVEKLSELESVEYDVVNRQNRSILKQYDQNHERFNQDINIRMAQNIMRPYQKNAFDILNTQPIERRAQLFAGAYPVRNKIRFENILSKNYSYGCLLEKIYSWGRVKSSGGNYLEDKPFIRCILASFTTELVREYLHYRYKEENLDESKYKMRLSGVLGSSFGNNWTGDAFPLVSVWVNGLPKVQKYGYQKGIEQKGLEITINVDTLRKRGIKKLDERELQHRIRLWLEREEVIETLEFIDMFFVRREGNTYRGIDYKFEYNYPVKEEISSLDNAVVNAEQKLDAKKTEDLQKVFTISGQGEKIDLDMMAFVAKSMNYKKERDRLQMNIVEGLTKALGVCLECDMDKNRMEVLRRTILEATEEHSLFNYLKSMRHGYEVAFPFYNLDMSYNVYKRVRKELLNKKIREEDLFSGILDFYSYIERNLEKEAKCYEESETFKYLEIFRECPYIRAIRNVDKSKSKVPERVIRAFNTMVVQTYIPEDVNSGRSATQ